MRVFNLIFFTSLIGTTWCGLILHNIRDSLHFDHGLHSDTKQNPSVININNNQQQATPINQHPQPHQLQQYGLKQRGDYGSLSSSGGYHSFVGALGMDANFKASGLNYHQGGNSYDSHAMNNGFDGGVSHHMMKQESQHHRSGSKFGHHHDNNMFGNTENSFAASSSSRSSISNGVKPWIRRN